MTMIMMNKSNNNSNNILTSIAYFLSISIVFLSMPSPSSSLSMVMVEGSTFFPRAATCSNSTTGGTNTGGTNTGMHMTAENAALAMNSIDFLKQLVRLKDTCDETYYQEGGYRYAYASVVEYTGKLWILNKSRVRFQEKVEIDEISPCGKYSQIHCTTRYKKTGSTTRSIHSEEGWVDCAKVSCRVQIQIPDDRIHTSTEKEKDVLDTNMNMNMNMNMNIDVQSDLLIKLPLFGMGKAVRRKISDTFETAAIDFFESSCVISTDDNQ